MQTSLNLKHHRSLLQCAPLEEEEEYEERPENRMDGFFSLVEPSSASPVILYESNFSWLASRLLPFYTTVLLNEILAQMVCGLKN